ncbi:MAG: TetR/AcrR family transcriptional regulator, partial [Lachnospiraceae bacterium]|nr:TetR/AcrR family transcriptional regulator [Lachnospiraceae bacterium]
SRSRHPPKDHKGIKMGRKTQITREMILNAAYELLDESGIGAVAIKTIAARLGCSTQPVSWQFGSMTELKKELYFHSVKMLYGALEEDMKSKDAVDAFFLSGIRYISGACDHPNVFKFVNVDDPRVTIGERIGGEASIFSIQFDAEAVKMFESEYDIPSKKIGEMVRDTVIYTHGLAVMMMFDNYRLPKKEACKMVLDMGIMQMQNLGIEIDKKKRSKLLKLLE